MSKYDKIHTNDFHPVNPGYPCITLQVHLCVKELSNMSFANFPQDAIFPLIVIGHEGSLPAIETKSQHCKMIGIIYHASRCYQEMIIVFHLVLHKWTMLEMGIE